MLFRIGLENKNDGRTIAWALEHLGCFAYGRDSQEAQVNFPPAAQAYVAWVRSHGGEWLADSEPGAADSGEFQLINEETFDVHFVDKAFERVEPGRGSMVESFFGYDWKPLTATDIQRALKLLAWSRLDLLGVVNGLSADQLSRAHAGERWDINGILKHIGAAEWWYQERIGHPFPANENDLSPNPLERLTATRVHFNSLLPRLEGLQQVIGLEGEFWSPRKVLRRTLWHERDHTQHIRKLL
jgi:hypothetical protein